MAKPSQGHIDWVVDEDPARFQDPGTALKSNGYSLGSIPASFHHNWIFGTIDRWLKHFETLTDALGGAQSVFDVTIGVDGSHSTLNAAIADTSLGNNLRVLVQDPATVIATQILSKEGWEITFKPNAFYSQGGNTAIGLQLNADRIKIIGARLTDFDTAGAIAIDLTSNASNCLITQCYFSGVNQDIRDNGTNNSLIANINEV